MNKTGNNQLQFKTRRDIIMNMNTVGSDVSKRKSTVAVLHPGGEVVVKPFDVHHLSVDFNSLTNLIKFLDGEARIVMECTRRYYSVTSKSIYFIFL